MRKLAICAGSALLIAGFQISSAAAASDPEPPGPAAEAYAKGQEHLARRTADDVRDAIDEFERATEADATFAPAYAGLAEARALLYDYPGAREVARRALELDERLASAHAVLGFVKMHDERDWAGAETELRRSLEIDPKSATPRLWYAILLEATGRADEAVGEARRAVELEPKDAKARAGLGYRLYWARRYDEAVTELTAALKLDPALDTAQYFIGRARVQQGRFKEARAAFARTRQLSPRDGNLLSAEAYLDALSGKRTQAEKAITELERLTSRGMRYSSQIAGIYAALGNKDAALRWLERAEAQREGALVWLKVDPRFDSLRGEPRFAEILRNMGLAGNAAL
jgi:tetratricopeptide (TPR) repeat protein